MAMSDAQRIEAQRRTIAEHIEAENAHDWPRVYGTFVQDEHAFYDVVPLSTRYAGFAGVQDFYRILDDAIPDFRVTVNAEYDSPGASVREVTIVGTHRGEYCGEQPSGRPVSFELAAFYIFRPEEPGKLLAERIYFDNETVLRQMRGEENAPAGIGLTAP
ncbi:Predicted ester cyclase [Saccharopolyspora antimicrobica]|uniref:Ester cyclase n=2 Tax=Saccharopolyspora antimicrobica TaxID=455193 RepID=A0A1I4QZQ6_9PSEU|nr:putative ester cyclase [Saccharopolyspora antimicrobica]SFM45564.1 Predicted ester cyclase [Saccharopolyspora antimicrobica]